MELQALKTEAVQLFQSHGLTGWTFAFSRAKRRLGVCKFARKQIEINEFYAIHNSEESVRDTLLHEIVHALAGPKAGHGPVWQAIALRIGATPTACDNSPETIVQPGAWQSTCSACSQTHHRYRRPGRLSRYRCNCPAGTPLVFTFAGSPLQAVRAHAIVRATPIWRAICPLCARVYRRERRPKPGRWRCRCPDMGELTWVYVREQSTEG